MLIESLTHSLTHSPVNLARLSLWVSHTKAHMLSFPPYSHNLLSTKVLPSPCGSASVFPGREENREVGFLFCCRLAKFEVTQ